MRCLVLGGGSIGLRHCSNLVALGAGEVAVFDPDAGRGEPARGAGASSVFAALDDAWAWKPAVVFVCSPTSLHAAQAAEALERGCDVFVEKPLASSAEGLDALLELAARTTAITMVGCNLRFHWAVSTIKRLLDEDAVGRVVTARFEFGQWLPDWRPGTDYRESYSARRELGGGIVLDAIHELDYAIWYLGEPTEVCGIARNLGVLGIGTEETADFVLRFSDGTVASVHEDYVQRVYRRGCTVAGDAGTVAWDWNEREVRLFRTATGAWETFPEPEGWQPNDMYVDELRHFLGCVERREATMNDLAFARRVLAVALSIERG